MPSREPNVNKVARPEPKERELNKHSDVIDLSFLPENYLNKINEIFDRYFGLGMKKRTDILEDSAPRFPSKISSMSSPDLGDTSAEYTAWYSYASDKFKFIVAACTYMEQEMQLALDMELGTMVGGGGNIETKKSKARTTEKYVSLRSYHQKLVGMKIMLSEELSNYDKCIASISREISRRELNGGF